VLELVFISILIIIGFIAISWFAVSRSEKLNRAFMINLAESFQPEKEGGEAFTKILNHALLDDKDVADIDTLEQEPTITLSPEAQNIESVSPVKVLSTESRFEHIALDDDPIYISENTHLSHDSKLKHQKKSSLEMVIAFTVMAQNNQHFLGLDLKTAFELQNLVFGKMGVYHKMNAGTHKVPLFSVANILEPGTFSPDTISSMTTPGVVLFATLPNVINNLALFDELYKTASLLAQQLSGVLSDQSREPITESTLEDMRSRIFSFNLTLQTEHHNHKHDENY
jgi:cell division protein ZipA